ncbi:MAG: GNAT family N-acetyltransferase [Vicinamibacterales bacterium]
MKPAVAPLARGELRLRLLEESDLPLTREWRNREDVRHWFFSSDIVTEQQHRAWYERYRDKASDLVFIVEETRRLRRPVGQVSLYHLDARDRSAEFGRLMIGDPAARGSGFGRGATELALDVAFGPLGLREVYLEVVPNNARAIDIYRACGFAESARESGVIRMVANASARGDRS